MNVEVRVDATGHTPAQLLRWSWSSLLSFVLRDGTAVPDRSDGRSRLFVATGPITPTRRRDVPLSMCETGRNPPALLNLFRPSDSAVDPAEHCHCSGAPCVDALSVSLLSDL